MALTDQSANIDAIERYIGEQEPPRTAAAVQVRDRFLRWLAGVSAWARAFDQGTYDVARNYRLEYNRANATTPAERAAVEEQALHGISTEQIDGSPDRRTSDGSYIPPSSAGTWVAIGAGGLAAVLLLKLLR